MKYINGKYYGLFNEVNLVQTPEDLQIFNCVDTGVQYRFFEGKWYKQPFYWVDSDDIDGGGGGGGSDLPDVTAADNGDVLTVVNGAWDKAEPSGGGGGGGGGALIVTVTKPSADVYRMDKTAMEIYDAMSTGKAVVVNFPDGQFYDNETSTVIAIHRDIGGDPFYNVQVWFEGNITPFAANENNSWYPTADFS